MMLAILGEPEKEELDFKVPEGVDLADLKDGEEREVVATIRKKPDGMACLVSLEGVPLEGYEEEETEEVDEEEEIPEASDEAPSDNMAAAPAGIGGRARSAGLM